MTDEDRVATDGAGISIHIPRVGDDFSCAINSSRELIFQSTSPAWGMTADEYKTFQAVHISIHIPRVGDDYDFIEKAEVGFISIHIPRVGDDF